MKKIMSILLLVSVLAGSLVFPVAAEDAYVPGDANGDGFVDMQDSVAIRAFSASPAGKVADFDAADINQDNRVDAKDLLMMKKHNAGLEDFNELYPTEFGDVGRFKIGENNIKHYTIVVTNPDNANMVFAAEELQKYVEMSTKVKLPIAEGTSDAEYKIVLREDEVGTLGNDGFSITVKDGQLTILGGALRGTMYGVYEIIEDYLGYRFYGGYDVKTPAAKTVGIPEGTTDTQIPDTLYRNNNLEPYRNQYTYNATIKRKLSGATSCSDMLVAKYGYGIQRFIANAHSFDLFIPSYTNTNGRPSRYCLTDIESFYDPETGEVEYLSVFGECLQNMCAKIDERVAAGWTVGKEITEISCSYSENIEFCLCPGCEPINVAAGANTGTLVYFVNLIDDAIDEIYGDKLTVITNTYGSTKVAPKNMKLNDDVVLLHCWNGCVNHTIESDACQENGVVFYNGVWMGSNKQEKEYYLDWMEVASQSYIWYYPVNIYYSLAPLSNFFNIYHDMKWFIENGAVGFYAKGDTTDEAFDKMKAYLISEMMWDKDITEEEYITMMQEYLSFYYGEGWENIYDILLMLEDAGDGMGCYMTEYSHPMAMYSRDYFIENFEVMKEKLAAAEDSANSEEEYDRIRCVEAYIYFLGLNSTYETEYVNGNEAQRAEYAKLYETWYDFVNEEGIRTSHSSVGISSEFTLDKSPCMLVYGFDD